MSDKTKSCLLTEEEIKFLISNHGAKLWDENKEKRIERISYLNKRLKAFKEPEIASNNSAAGWGNAPATSTVEGE